MKQSSLVLIFTLVAAVAIRGWWGDVPTSAALTQGQSLSATDIPIATATLTPTSELSPTLSLAPVAQPTLAAATLGAPTSTAAQEPLWKSLVVAVVGGLAGGVIGAIITLYIWRRERTSFYRQTLYVRQLETCLEMLSAADDLFTSVDDSASKRRRMVKALAKPVMVLPRELTRPFANLISIATKGGDELEYTDALFKLTLEIRKRFGIGELSQEILDLLKLKPSEEQSHE